MPIYEYYCPACHGQFSHLARKIDAPAPSCPRCGNDQVERMVSRVNFVHSETQRTREFRQEATQVSGDDPQAIARFLKDSGRLADADGLYGSRAYRELIERRAEGATDADLADLSDELTSQLEVSEATKTAGAVLFSDRMENRMQAEGPPEDHEHEVHAKSEARSEQSTPRRAPDDLGWA